MTKENFMTEKKKNIIFLIISGILLFLSAILLFLALYITGFAQWYSTNVYPIWVASVGRFFGIFPFSVAEILLYLLVLAFIVRFAYTIYRLIRKEGRLKTILSYLIRLFLVCSILIFLFVVNCGINYHRLSFAKTANLEVRESSVEELELLVLWLIDEVNGRANQVERNADGVMVLTTDLSQAAVEAMHTLAHVYPVLGGYYPRPKEVLTPILSMQQVSGIFSPFTIEANFNGAMPGFNIPFTATHELAHVRGFMSEDEANFIAFLACIHSGYVEFEYSGYVLAWIYANNALARVDRESAAAMRARLAEEVQVDLSANRVFWARFDGPVAEMQREVNDRYLRANRQEFGIQSYGMMVDLLLAYVREGHFD